MKRWALVLLLAAQSVTLLERVDQIQKALDGLRSAVAGPQYTALTDRSVRPRPAPRALGPAGSSWTDPTFGSRIWRVTDEQTDGGKSLRVASNTSVAAWNADGSTFFVMGEGGNAVFFGFDGETVTRKPVTIASQIEPSFSYTDPNLILGVVGRRVIRWALGGFTQELVNLDTLYPQLALSGYVGGLVTSDAAWVTFFGGQGQDQHVYVHHSTAGLLDVRAKGWKIHSVSMDRTGRYVIVYPANPGGAVAQIYIWDTLTGSLTPVPRLNGGHASLGYGQLVNADCCTAGPWDAAQWQFRRLPTPDVTTDLVTSPTPKEIYLSEHSNWRAARPDVQVPFVSATFRAGQGIDPSIPWRAWDDEIIAVASDGSGTVWRFAHHQSIATDFWSQPIVNVAPDGRHAIVTSNWGGRPRQDVFLVELK